MEGNKRNRAASGKDPGRKTAPIPKQRRKMFTLWDAGLLGLLLSVGIGVLLLLRGAAPGETAVILQDGRELYRIPLAEGREKTVYTVPNSPIRIAAEGKEAWFEDSDCPDRLCVRQGRLSRKGEAAACLPNGVVLQIDGAGAPEDAITG